MSVELDVYIWNIQVSFLLDESRKVNYYSYQEM